MHHEGYVSCGSNVYTEKDLVGEGAHILEGIGEGPWIQLVS